MKNLILIIILFSFSSCLTVKQIERNCDKFMKVCVTETVKEIVYRDTTIYKTDTILVTLPRDTVTISDTVRIINDKAFMPDIYKEFGLIGVKAGINNSILNVSAWLTDSTILYPRMDTIVIENAIKAETTTNTVEVRYVPKFYKIIIGIVIALILACIVGIILKLKGICF